MNKIERNYEIHDKEMLAVIKGLENWRHILEKTKFKFEVWYQIQFTLGDESPLGWLENA